jgi:Mrp family chromosome partitioning ATPase
VDSPPLQVVTDAALLASRTDGALLVIDGGRTRKGAVRQARETLDRVGARLLGASINRLSERGNTGYYYYYYQYQYYGKYTSGSGTSGSKPPAPETAAR